MRALVVVALLSGGIARADEPSVGELQRRATELAGVQPSRARALERRLRASPLLPSLRIAASRGARDLTGVVTAPDGSERLTALGGDAWRVEASASWQLGHLVFQHDELALLREGQRLALHRERLVERVARLYFERRRRLTALAAIPTVDRAEAELQIDELTAVLDGLTGGALTATSRERIP